MCTQGVIAHWLLTKRGVGRPNCRHVTFKVEWVNPVEEQACTNSRTVPNGQLTGSSWQPPHHEVKVPTSRRTVSSLRELWIGVRSQQPRLRDRKLRVAPLRGHTQNFHISGRGWRPPLVRGDPSWLESPKESRRGGKSDPRTILGPARTGLLIAAELRPGALSPEPRGADRCEASIPQAKAPVSTGCLLPHWDAQVCKLLWVRGVCPGPTQGSGAPTCTGDATSDLPGGWYKRPPLCCRCELTHGDLLGLGESISEPETRPASRACWWAKRDDLSTDRGQGGHSWPLPNRWGMRPSLAYAATRSSQHRALRQEPRLSPHV